MTYHIGASAARDGRRFKRASTLINIFNLFNPLQGNRKRCVDGAKAEANREQYKAKRKQAIMFVDETNTIGESSAIIRLT